MAPGWFHAVEYMEFVRAKRHTPVGLSAKARVESASAGRRTLFMVDLTDGQVFLFQILLEIPQLSIFQGY